MYRKVIVIAVFISATYSGMHAENMFRNNFELMDTSKVVDLDEVVVVAQPKENQRLRLQPVAASVFSSKEMDMLKINDLKDLSNIVPTFVMPSYGSRLTSAMYIRGIGSRINYPAVGMYVDGIPYVSKNSYNSHLYGIDRIDVLRGPQGTLYGQNTMGGLVRIYSKNPMTYQGTDVKLGIGTHFYRNMEFDHYCKLSDKFAFSLSGFYDGQNGFFKNVTLDKKADLMNEAGGKLRMIYAPTKRLSFDFNTNYEYVNQNAFPYADYDLTTGNVGDITANYLGGYKRNMLNTGINVKYEADRFIFNSTTSYQFLKDYMTMDTDNSASDFMYLEQHQKQNSITQEFTFKNARQGKYQWICGVFGSYQWLKTNAPVYFGSDFGKTVSTPIETSMYNAMVNSMAAAMIAQGMPQATAETLAAANIAKAGGVSMNVGMVVPGYFSTPQANLGIYHQSSFDITDRLNATIGLRFDYERVSIDYDTYANMTLTANVMGSIATNILSSKLLNSAHHDYTQLLPKFALTYKIFDNGSNVYASVSKGFRSGGYNIQMFSDILQTELNNNSKNAMRSSYDIPHSATDYNNVNNTISYKPETSWNYEAGTHLNLFDNKIHADFSLFYMRVCNQQLSVFANQYGFGRMMVNAGRSESCGVELAVRGSALDNKMQWSVNYGFTHSVFKDYKDSVAVNGVNTEKDYSGKKIPFVPAHTFGANADYRFDVSKGCALKGIVLGANVNGSGKIYWDEENTMCQKIYAVLGAHLDFDFGPVDISFWGKNLTDTKYNTFAFSNSATGTAKYYAQRGNPVQVGMDLKLHF
jgi:iron complex outermembrane recepter protein